jgi:hypothetical protein
MNFSGANEHYIFQHQHRIEEYTEFKGKILDLAVGNPRMIGATI